MMYLNRLGQVLIVALVTLTTSYAQETPTKLGGFKEPAPFQLRKSTCPACTFLANQFNDAREELLDEGDYLDDLDVNIAENERNLKRVEADNAHRKSQFIRQPSPSLENQIKAGDEQQAALTRQLARQEKDFDRGERQYNDMMDEIKDINAKLTDCEARFCHITMANPVARLFYMHYLAQMEVGLMLGNFTSSRKGLLDTPTELFSGTNSQNNFLFGPQVRFLFATQIQTFLLINALTMFNATNTLLNVKTDSFSSYNSRLRLTTVWVAHILLGLQTQMFLNRFNFSAGLGGAVVDQNLKTSIGEVGLTNTTKDKTSLAPSWMVGINYNLCNSCVYGHGLTLSGQFTADRYPEVTSTQTTPLGNKIQSKAQQNWQYAESLGLAVRF